jgi:hypothetical protein
MPRTRQFVLASLVLVIGIGFGVVLSGVLSRQQSDGPDYGSVDDLTSHDTEVLAFKASIETAVAAKQGKGDGGYAPEEILAAFPGLTQEDFNGVQAVLGHYEMKDGQLVYSNEEVLDAAAGDLVAKGYEVLRANVYRRLKIDPSTDPAKVVSQLQGETATSTKPVNPIPPPTAAGTVCPQDVKQCPDGSFVSRHGVNCTFDVCGGEGSGVQSVACKPNERLVDACTEQYDPVCAAYQVQCITAPCNPVPKKYSNSCFACMDKNVISYSKGECIPQ